MQDLIVHASSDRDETTGANDQQNDVGLKNTIAQIGTSIQMLTGQFESLLLSHQTQSDEYVEIIGKYQIASHKVITLTKTMNNLKQELTNQKDQFMFESSVNSDLEIQRANIELYQVTKKIETRHSEHNKKIEQLTNELELAETTAFLEENVLNTSLQATLTDLNTNICRQRKLNDDLTLQIQELEATKSRSLIHTNTLLNDFHLGQAEDIFSTSLALDDSDDDKLPKFSFKKRQSISHNESKVSSEPTIDIQSQITAEASFDVETLSRTPKAKKPSKVDLSRTNKYSPLLNNSVELPSFKTKSKPKRQVKKTSENFSPLPPEPKKRKLYNANKLDYLDKLINSNNN